MGRVVNVPGTIRAKEIGNGVCELEKTVDVLCVMKEKSRKKYRRIMTVGTVALFAGLAAALIYLAPALGTILFAVVAWCGFAASATGE